MERLTLEESSSEQKIFLADSLSSSASPDATSNSKGKSEANLHGEETSLVPPVDSNKKRKKKKAKKTSGKAAPAVLEPQSPVLCISRNKHWRYISSYHGPWLQLPLELLESLSLLNLDPATFASISDPKLPRASSNSLDTGSFKVPPHPRGVPISVPEDDAQSNSPLIANSPQINPNQPIPPPIDPGVFKSVTSIRRLIDEASDLAVRAASGLSAAALGSVRGGNPSSYNGSSPWITAQTLGLSALGEQGGNGRSVPMSATRIHRLRCLAVSRLAAAYRADEIAASVMVMQGASALDDIAERVLKLEPTNCDARYVHFFHEKIPSRQLAECTSTAVLDELIAAQPQILEYYRTRGVVRCFRDEFQQAIRDFTSALKEARASRKSKHAHTMAAAAEAQHQADHKRAPKIRKGRKCLGKTNGQAPPDGTAAASGDAEDSDMASIHASLRPTAPEAIEPQLLFLRGAAYLQNAVFQIEKTILELEEITKVPSTDGTELRLCHIAHGVYGGVEIGNPDGPLGDRYGPKALAYRMRLATPDYRESLTGLLRKSMRDHEKFLSHFDTLHDPVTPTSKSEAETSEMAFRISESARPGSGVSPPTAADGPPSSFTTYHPLLVESHFSVLLCLMLLGDFEALLPAFSKAALLIDGLEGYPIFLPARSMAQAEFIEILERLARGWRAGSASPSSKQRRAIEQPPRDANAHTPGSQQAKSVRTEEENFRAFTALRTILTPVVNRQRDRAMQATNGADKKTPAINIPLHGPRVEIVLAWLAATFLPEMEDSAKWARES